MSEKLEYSVFNGTDKPATLFFIDEYGTDVDLAEFEKWDTDEMKIYANRIVHRYNTYQDLLYVAQKGLAYMKAVNGVPMPITDLKEDISDAEQAISEARK
jgi:hypothetical protein